VDGSSKEKSLKALLFLRLLEGHNDLRQIQPSIGIFTHPSFFCELPIDYYPFRW